jgi:hypothetical protein
MKSSDLGLTLIILLVFILFYIFNILAIGTQNVKNNWPNYRCNPMVMPFAGTLGPEGTNATDNFTYCIQTMQNSYMQYLLQPIHYNLNVIGNTSGLLTNSVNDVREFFNKLRNMVTDTIKSIFSVFLNIIIEFQRLIIDIKDLMGKIVGILTTMIFIMDGSLKTMNSAWAGPNGKLVRALCFHPDTLIQLENKEYIKMKDIKLGARLINNSIVEGVMILNNLDEKNNQIEAFYEIDGGNNKIYVTGSHLIYNKEIDNFQQVCDYSDSKLTNIKTDYFSCLITNNHIITIGNKIFHDWEDNNGSKSKE